MQAQMLATPPSREIATPSQTSTIPTSAGAPIIAHGTNGSFTISGRPDKQPMTFSRKMGRGH